MGRMSMPSKNGDDETLWGTDAESIANAEKQFEAYKKTAYAPFALMGDGTHQRLDKFDPAVGEIVWVRRMFGG